ncbi:MAG: hypothetical protein Q4C58_09525 [Eubacteriales bacterium]|nr:hypothetical protein [Eubacteriales bacterium]
MKKKMIGRAGICRWLCAFLMGVLVMAGSKSLTAQAFEYDYKAEDVSVGMQLFPNEIFLVQAENNLDVLCICLDEDGNELERFSSCLNNFTMLVRTYKKDLPEGKEFKYWVVTQSDYSDTAWTLKYQAVLGDITEKTETAAPAPAPSISPEEAYLKQWQAWIKDVRSYLPTLTLPNGSKESSVVPTLNMCIDGTGFIVPGPIENTESAFEKTSAGNQIVVTVWNSACGNEMKASMDLLAAGAGGTVKAIYEVSAMERTKADYSLVREIEKVSQPVEYRIWPAQEIREAAAQGRTVMVFQYVPGDKNFVQVDAAILSGGLLSVWTNYPTGIFAVVVV